MVQYSSYHSLRGGDSLLASRSDQWKLQSRQTPTGTEIKRYFQQRQIAFRKSSNIERLREQYTRVVRGLVVYDKCSVEELRSFCSNRGLPMTATASRGKAPLIQLLEEADEDVTFDKLFALSAELREMIYEFHFGSFDLSYINTVFPLW